MNIIERKSRNQVHLVGLERLRGEFERIRALNKKDPLELKKGRGVHDDDSTAMTEATISIASSDESMSSSIADEVVSVPMQRSHQLRPDLNCDTASCVTPQASNKAKKTKSPSRPTPKVDVDDKNKSEAEENSTPPESFFDEINNYLMSCFSCSGSYTPPTSTFLHYNNIPAPEPEIALEEEDYFNRRSLARLPYANRLG
jgi:hypothetical protein